MNARGNGGSGPRPSPWPSPCRLATVAAILLFATSLAVEAQPPGKAYRVGFLSTSPPEGSKALLDAFLNGLRQFGYSQGTNLAVEHRWTAGTPDRLDALARELVQGQVDVILAWGTPATGAAKRATTKIPIVMVGVGDPIGAGFVHTLSRPGGNITGVSNISRDLSGKVLALLKEVVPGAARIGVLRNPGNPVAKLQLVEAERAAQSLGIRLHLSDAREPRDLEAAFAAMGRERVAGVTALADPMFLSQSKQIAQFALRARLPSAFARRENVDAGGLMSYGPNLADQFRSAGGYVHRILQGATPGDLPVEEPTRLELIVNLNAARALGITIPPSLLLQADQVLE